MQKTLIVALTLLAFSLPTLADNAAIKHTCAKPAHPGSLASEARMKSFQQEVNTYRECITKFTEEQKKQIKIHEDAGNVAVEEFNTFAKNELNPKKEEDGPAK
jgi:hypothetical protein